MNRRAVNFSVVIAIVGIVVTIAIYVTRTCDNKTSKEADLSTTINSQSNNIEALFERGDNIISRIGVIDMLSDKNNKFIRRGQVREEMEEHIGMASRAIQQFGRNCDLIENDSNKEQWFNILRDVGFSLEEQISRTIMAELTDSSAGAISPVNNSLLSPWHACEFVTSMREWKQQDASLAANFLNNTNLS